MPDYSINDERALWEGFRAGDAACTDLLLKKYSPLVRSCARSYFLTGGELEDLIQEGMLALLNALHAYSPDRGTGFGSFASVCIRNRIIDTVKSYNNGRDALGHTLSLDLYDLEETDSAVPASASDPEDLLIRSERASGILEQLHKSLSSLERTILDDYLAGLSYGEIARRCGRTTKSVDNTVQRIRRKVQAIINSSDNSES